MQDVRGVLGAGTPDRRTEQPHPKLLELTGEMYLEVHSEYCSVVGKLATERGRNFCGQARSYETILNSPDRRAARRPNMQSCSSRTFETIAPCLPCGLHRSDMDLCGTTQAFPSTSDVPSEILTKDARRLHYEKQAMV